MKILHVFKTYFPESQGGVEETIRQICMSTKVFGAENHVLTLGSAKETDILYHDEASIIRFHRNFEIASTGISLQALQYFKQEANKADIIHYHFPWPFADVMHLVSGIRKPSILTYHSDIVRQKLLVHFYRPVMNYFFRHMDVIVATSPNYVHSSSVLKKTNKLEIVPIGIDEKSYPVCDPVIKRKLSRRTGKDFFLFIGVMRYYKGLHTLLDAARGTTLPVVIAGAGPIEKELKEKKETLGLDHVIFLGRVSNQQRTALYEMCRAVVFPSNMRSEAFGLTLVEGAMYGKPLVSTELGTGTSYVNVDGETGIVVPPGNPIALRKALLKLQDEPETAQMLGNNARHRYEHFFTADMMGKSYWDIYRRLR